MAFRKPKFTPDPPPNVDGLPVEQQVKMYFDWVQREVNRIEDWWPNDQSARINLIEELLGCISEPFVVLAYGTVDAPYVTALTLQCGVTTLISDGVFPASDNFVWGIDYSPNTNELVFTTAKSGAATEFPTFRVHETTDAVNLVTPDTQTPVSPLKIVSSSGTTSFDKAIFTWSGASGFTKIDVYTVSGWVFDQGVGNPLGANNALRILAETDSYYGFYQQSSGNFAVADKSTLTVSNINVPSGWSHSYEAAAMQSSTNFIIPLENTTTNDWSFFTQTGTSHILIGDKLVDCDTDITDFKSTGLIIGSKIFWAVDTASGSPNNSKVLVTNLSGTQLALVDSTIGLGAWTSGQTYLRLTPEGTTHLWWYEGAKVYRMNADTYAIESCTPDPTDARIQFSGAVYVRGDFMYLADASALDSPPTSTFKVLAKTEAYA